MRNTRTGTKGFLTFTIHCFQTAVCREDSCHSVMSCTAVLLSPVDPGKEVNMLEEPKCPEPSKQ